MKELVPRLASGRLGRTERQGEEPPCGAGRRTPLWGPRRRPAGPFVKVDTPIRSSRSGLLDGHPTLAHVPVRRFAEQPLVFPVELCSAFIAHGQRRAAGVLVFRQHQTLGFVQAEPLVVLQRAEPRDFLEMPVKRGRRHVDAPGQFFHLKRFPVVRPQP